MKKLIFLILFINNVSLGASYYVGKTNCLNTGPGSPVQPFCTIQTGINKLVTGDTLNIFSGTYVEKVLVKTSGTAAAPITIKSASTTDTPILDGTGITLYDVGLFHMNGKAYININGLTIKNSLYWAINVVNSHHITIDKVVINTAKHGGIVFDNGSYELIVKNCDISYTDKCGQNCGIHEALTFSKCTKFKAFNNYVHHGIKEGIDVKDGSTYGEIFDNHVAYMGQVGLYLNHAQYIKMYRNNVHDNGTTGMLLGIGDNATSEANTSYNEIYQNLFWNNKALGIQFFNDAAPTTAKMINNKIFNNVIYKNAYEGIGIEVGSTVAYGNIFRNNILMSNQEGVGAASAVVSANTFSNNLFFSTGTGAIGTNNVLVDPKFIAPSTGNFQLQAFSPAIDKGFDMGLYKINLTDIGRWEYGLAVTVTDSAPILFKDAGVCSCPCPCTSSTSIKTNTPKSSTPVNTNTQPTILFVSGLALGAIVGAAACKKKIK